VQPDNGTLSRSRVSQAVEHLRKDLGLLLSVQISMRDAQRNFFRFRLEFEGTREIPVDLHDRKSRLETIAMHRVQNDNNEPEPTSKRLNMGEWRANNHLLTKRWKILGWYWRPRKLKPGYYDVNNWTKYVRGETEVDYKTTHAGATGVNAAPDRREVQV
jgi:hypothetical protein